MIDFDHNGIPERVGLLDFCSPYFTAARAILQIFARNDFARHVSPQIIGMRSKQMAVVAACDPLNNGHVGTGRDLFSHEVALVWKIRAHITLAER